MTTKTELLQEARRCAYNASRGVSPGQRQMFTGLARFYGSLAQSGADARREESSGAVERPAQQK